MSLSFVLTVSCFAFLLYAILYVFVDYKQYWSGAPFNYAGICYLIYKFLFPVESFFISFIIQCSNMYFIFYALTATKMSFTYFYFYICFRFESNYSLCWAYCHQGHISMGLDTVTCYTLVSSRYEFVDHNVMGCYCILVIFKRHYYICLKLIMSKILLMILS